MDRALLTSLKAAGVNEGIISILEDEEFDTVDILNNTSDELLRSCNIKGGHIVRIRKALSAIAKEDLEVCQIMHANENQGYQAENEPIPIIPPNTPASSSTPTCPLPCTPIRPSTPSRRPTSSLERILSDIESPGQISSPQTSTPSPGFAIREKRAANTNWIKDYKLPELFSSRVQKDLTDGKLSGNHRDEFTRDVVSSIKVHTMYPTTEEKQKIASLIIQKYPFLADSIGAGTGSWCKAITNRFKNLRRKKLSGDVPINKNKKANQTTPSTTEPSTKKRKISDLPQLPEGETPETCREHKKVLIKEMAKSRRNLPLIKDLMELTYSHRRHEFLKQPKRVEEILEEYPAFHLISEMKAEFGRILGQTKIIREMVDSFKSLEEQIIQYASRCTKRSIKNLKSMMERSLEEDPHKESDIRSMVAALIIQDILKERMAEQLFLKVCCDDESIDAEIQKSTYPRLIGSGDLANVNPLFIVAEGEQFLDLSNLSHDRVPMAVALLVGSFYILNMEYTPGVSNVYAFLEATLLNRPQEAKKRISVQKFIKELDMNFNN